MKFLFEKSRNFFLAIALLVGLSNLGLGTTSVAAQVYGDIVALDTFTYKNGVEIYLGGAVPGSSEVLRLTDAGFATPADVRFDRNAYRLAIGSIFSISDVDFYPTGDTLFVTVNFQPASNTPFGEYVDTLFIEAEDANSFVLPLRATSLPFELEPRSLDFEESVLPYETSDVALTALLTTAERNPENFKIVFVDGTAFSAQLRAAAPGDISVFDIQVLFNPREADLGGTLYTDTLVVSHPVYPNVVDKIPVSGFSTKIAINPSTLLFGAFPVGVTDTLVTSVRTTYTDAPLEIALYDSVRFDAWLDDGQLYVTFTPDTTYRISTTIEVWNAEHTDSTLVFAAGIGRNAPVISSDTTEYNFGIVPVGKPVALDIRIFQSDPVKHLSESSFSFSDPGETAFNIEAFLPDPSAENDTVWLTVSFTPDRADYIENKIVVRSPYADDFEIQLTGEGEETSPALAPQQTTALSGREAVAAPSVSVKAGEIAVSGAPVGSSIRVYDLQGKALQTRAVTSLMETLKTATLPKSVYVVIVNNDKQEILKQKVVL
jgi:hypothetical protein